MHLFFFYVHRRCCCRLAFFMGLVMLPHIHIIFNHLCLLLCVFRFYISMCRHIVHSYFIFTFGFFDFFFWWNRICLCSLWQNQYLLFTWSWKNVFEQPLRKMVRSSCRSLIQVIIILVFESVRLQLSCEQSVSFFMVQFLESRTFS